MRLRHVGSTGEELSSQIFENGKIKLLGGDWVQERLKQAQLNLGVLQGIEQIMQFRLTLSLLQNFKGIKR